MWEVVDQMAQQQCLWQQQQTCPCHGADTLQWSPLSLVNPPKTCGTEHRKNVLSIIRTDPSQYSCLVFSKVNSYYFFKCLGFKVCKAQCLSTNLGFYHTLTAELHVLLCFQGKFKSSFNSEYPEIKASLLSLSLFYAYFYTFICNTHIETVHISGVGYDISICIYSV